MKRLVWIILGVWGAVIPAQATRPPGRRWILAVCTPPTLLAQPAAQFAARRN